MWRTIKSSGECSWTGSHNQCSWWYTERDLRSSSWQVLLSLWRARQCTREVSGSGVSGEREDEVATDERKRKKSSLSRRLRATAGFSPGTRALSGRHVGASTFKMQIRERRSGGTNADVNVRAPGGKCFIGASFRFSLPRLGAGRERAMRRRPIARCYRADKVTAPFPSLTVR